jgi:hypothetical protein
MSPVAKGAVREAGLDDHHSARRPMANQRDAQARVAKVQKVAAQGWSAGEAEPMDRPAGVRPPTVPKTGGGTPAARLDRVGHRSD